MNKLEQISISPDVTLTGWSPIIGNETMALLSHLGLAAESAQKLIDESVEILSKCGNPSLKFNSEIGLVFGYIQSGKTMSFTTLAALAKDNGYQMIIIIAGISTNLVDQSFTRLERDLRIDLRNDLQWISFKNPKLSDVTTRNQISNVLNEYRDATFPKHARKTILITVMKQRNHLPNLQALLKTLNLKSVPTLIIDDEGDQHSMNRYAKQNAKKGSNRRSVINEKVVNLKNLIPHHTFIQYTATPQAPLFIDIMNELSPNFIQLLTPGSQYTGGKVFFIENPSITKIISDIDPQVESSIPPQSLIYAMQIFFLGVVKGIDSREGKKRSMMIHPSQLTYTHSEYFRFVNTIKENFVRLLSLPDNNPDKLDLLEEFKEAYEDLSSTTSDLPSFKELSGDRLRHVINSTVVQSLNSRWGNTTFVDWRNSYSFIVIGGQAMDRGFTVEGLTVTYMPRSIGVGNADTIQQRARFFGYKQSYLGYCRVYLDKEAYESYVHYVEHEEDMRKRLLGHKKSGKSLNEWYREVFLTSKLKLARENVFSKEFERSVLSGQWYSTKCPHIPEGNISNNVKVINNFIKNKSFKKSGGFQSLNLSLIDFYEDVLNLLKYPNQVDEKEYISLLYVLDSLIEEDPDTVCTVYFMSTFDEPRLRNINLDNNQINQIFQGRSSNYTGDRSMLGSGITFQIHIINLLKADRLFISKVPALAAYIPAALGKDVIRWSN